MMLADLILALVAAPLFALMAFGGFMLHVWSRERRQFWRVTAAARDAARNYRR